MEFVGKRGFKKGVYFFLSLIFNFLVISPVYLNFNQRFLISGLTTAFLGWLLLSINPFSYKKGLMLLFFPCNLLLIWVVIYQTFFDCTFLLLPIALISALGTFFCINLFFEKRNYFIVFKSSLYVIFIIISWYYLPNYYNIMVQREVGSYLVNRNLNEDLVFFDDNNKRFDIGKLKGKISVIDVWTSSCSVCIKKFPQFEDVKKKYSNDKNIQFISLNIPIKRDKREIVKKITQKYTFAKLYADTLVQEKLKIKKFPQYLVVDEKLKIKYIGDMLVEENEKYNNFFDIINTIKNENN